MSDSPDMDRDRIEQQRRRRVRLVSLEADVAYFEARLEILGEPVTANQRAQHKAFKLLHQSLGDLILKTKLQRMDDG